MPFYEIVFETGRSSVAFYDSDAEMQSATKAHHERAVEGLPGGPIGQPAERIKSVYKYDKHPNEYNPSQGVSADVLNSEVKNLVELLKDENGVVSVDQLAIEVRNLTHPHVNAKESAFDSNYKMKEESVVNVKFLEA